MLVPFLFGATERRILMKKILLLALCIYFLLNICFITTSTSSAKAEKRTKNNDEVLKEAKLASAAIRDKELDYVLTDHLLTNISTFNHYFKFRVNPNRETYKDMVRRLYESYWLRYNHEENYRLFYRAFGRTTADNLKWMFENWKFVKHMYQDE